MRPLWLPLCCVLAGITAAQADSYRDKDDGFNPMNLMQGMPNPMNMFDSSDNRRDDRPRRPPPPPRGAPYPYPAPPAYGMPHAPMPPYYSGPTIQPLPQPAVQSDAQDLSTHHPEPAANPPYGSVPPPRNPAMPSALPDTAQPAYSFRPMTPAQPQLPASATEQPPPVQPQAPASTGETVLSTPYSAQETPMVNGHPAVFRPMHLGVDDPPAQ